MKNTKELENIKKAIRKWMEKYQGGVQFIGSFVAFKGKNSKVVDDLIVGYGSKATIQLALDEINKMVKKENKFINW